MADKLRRKFPLSLHGAPALLPAEPTQLRMALEEWFDSLEIRPVVVAEFEDPAFMTVMAAEGQGVIAIPSVIEHETLQRYGLRAFGRTDECLHQYYAITAERRMRHPAVIAITDHSRTDLLS
jgi:LysR family transcriptional activator of nhaA